MAQHTVQKDKTIFAGDNEEQVMPAGFGAPHPGGNHYFKHYPCQYELSSLVLREISRNAFEDGPHGKNIFCIDGITDPEAESKRYQNDPLDHWLNTISRKIFTEGLTGQEGFIREVTRMIMRKNPDRTMSQVMAEMFIHQQADPAFLIAMHCLTREEIPLFVDEKTTLMINRLTKLNSRGIASAWTYIGEDIKLVEYNSTFVSNMTINMLSNIPESVLSSLQGKQLKALLTHPVLNRHDLDINEIRIHGQAATRPEGVLDVEITLKANMRQLTMAEFDALRA